MSVSAFVGIDDGYTLDGKIKAAPGIYPEMSFKYRPVSWTERNHLRGLAGEFEKQGDFADKLIAAKVVSWNFEEPVGLSSVKRMRAALKSAVLDLICEYAASDEAEADAKN